MGFFDDLTFEVFDIVKGKQCVHVVIENKTEFTLERTANAVDHGQWIDRGPEYREGPPERIKPGEKIHRIATLLGEGDTIEICVRYKFAGDNKDVFVIHIKDQRLSSNKYYDTGLENWAKQDWLLAEEGDFRYKTTGWNALKVDAGFVLRRHPFGHQGGDEPLDPRGYTIHAPSAVVYGDKIYLFYTGQHEGRMWYTIYENVGGQYKWRASHSEDCLRLSGSPSAVSYKDRIYVFHTSQDGGELRYNVFNPTKGEWGQWSTDTGPPLKEVGISESPSPTVYDGKIYIAHQGHNQSGEMWWLTFDDEHGFSKDQKIEGVGCSQSPSLVEYQGKLKCFHQGLGNNGDLFWTEYDRTTGKWSKDDQIKGVQLNYSPSTVVADNRLFVFHKDHGARGRLWCNMWDGKGWSGDIEFTDSHVGHAPGAVVFGTAIWVFHRSGSGHEIRVKTIGVPK